VKNYKNMTKEELIKALKELSSEQNIKYFDYEDTLHELEKHQIELETQKIELQESRINLEESRNRYQFLYDFAPVGYCTLDEKGIIKEINLTGATMLGLERKDLSDMPFSVFASKEDMGKIFNHLKKCKEKMEKTSTEICLKEKNEQTTWIELLSFPIDSSGELMFQTIITDITGRKQADEALTRSEIRYRCLFESAKDGILIIDVETGKIIDVNQFLIKLLGYSKEQFIEKSIWEIGFFKDTIANKDKFLELQQMKYVRYENLPLETADGRKINVEFVSNVYLEDRHKVIQCNIRDITERKQAEKYREMRQEVLHILNDPGDMQDSIQRVLSALKTMTGFDAVGIRLQDGDDFPYFVQKGFSSDFLLTENTLIKRATDGGVCRDKYGNVNLECTCGLVISGKIDSANPLFTPGGSFWTNDSFPLLHIPPDEDPRLHPRNNCIHQGYASVALVPIRNKDKIIGLIQFNDQHKGCFTLNAVEILEGIAAHIGSALMRKQTEEEQKKLQDQLAQAQKMESVGRLAGGIAHNFNNMLAIILGCVEITLDEIDPANPIIANLHTIRSAAKRSADIVKHLMVFTHKQIVMPHVIDLNETVNGMLNMLRNLIGEDIDIVWKPAVNIDPVKIDPIQIDQIMANLMVNARDAISGVGKVTIETDNAVFDEAYCAAYKGYVPGKYVMLAVSDNGCGMDREIMKNIFEPFFTTKEVGKGTGLGLATVYGTVWQNNGFINVYSEPGLGTTFKIYLPRYAEKTIVASEAGPAEAVTGGMETVLIVEDEKTLLELTEAILKKLGYTVLTAHTPNVALHLAGEYSGEIHLLITDMVMPEMNGSDLAKQMISLYPNLKCLFMSGYTANVVVHNDILDKGMNFIPKPFSMKELDAGVREALKQK